MKKEFSRIIEDLSELNAFIISICGVAIFITLGLTYDWDPIVFLGILLYTTFVIVTLTFNANTNILSKGYKRLIFVLNILISVIAGLIFSDDLLLVILFSVNICWVLVYIVLWIYDGFKKT